MTQDQAFERIRASGLHVRNLGEEHGIVGGSHVDRSSMFGMVQNSFMLRRNPEGLYWVDLEEGSQKLTLPLAEAVDLVLRTVTPQPDIEAPPPRPGPQLY